MQAARRPVPGTRSRPSVAVMRDRRARRRRPLAADHLGLAAPHVVEDDRHVAARPVEMRLDDLQREGGRDGGVEGVAAALQHAHADRGRDPVGRRDDAEGAVDLGTGGEAVGLTKPMIDRARRSGRMYASTINRPAEAVQLAIFGMSVIDVRRPPYLHRRIYGEAKVTDGESVQIRKQPGGPLPKEFRFASDEVEIFRRGDEVVLREKPRNLMGSDQILVRAAGRRLDGSGDHRGQPASGAQGAVMALRYMLDTNIFIQIRPQPPRSRP